MTGDGFAEDGSAILKRYGGLNVRSHAALQRADKILTRRTFTLEAVPRCWRAALSRSAMPVSNDSKPGQSHPDRHQRLISSTTDTWRL